MEPNMYVLTNGEGKVLQYPYHPDMLRYAHPNVSFPAQMTDTQLAEWNVFEVAQTPIPTYNSLTHKITNADPVYNGGWQQHWTVTAMDDGEAQQAKDEAISALRAERNARLDACDWTQMPDVQLTADEKASWAKYRQSLRDLPANTDNPANPVWPVAPGGR